MQTDEQQLRSLHREREELGEFLRRHGRAVSWRAGLAIPIMVCVVTFLVAAVIAGQLSLAGLFWSIVLGGLCAYVLTRELRWQGMAISVLDIITLMMGTGFGPREDVDQVRKRLAECEMKIKQLEDRAANG